MTVADVCAMLGVSRNTVRSLVARGELVPSYVTDARPRFEAHEVRDFVRRHRRPAVPAEEQAVEDALVAELDAREFTPA
jgi:excisionase family DNA binding protein